MTPEQMKVLGFRAGDLLTNPAFTQAVDDLQDSLATRFFTSQFEDKEGRERIYNLRLCLDALIGNLQGYVLQKQQIEMLEQTYER